MKAKRLLKSLAFFLLSSFVIVYTIIQLVSGLTTDAKYEYTSVQTVEHTLEKSAYLVRNETVLYAANDGVLTYSVSESQKLGKDQLVATVFSSESGVDIQKQIFQIDEKIALLERSTVDAGYMTADITKIDEKIYDSLIKIRSAMDNNDISLATQMKEDLLISYNKRHLIKTGKTQYDDQILALQQEKNKLTASLQNALCTVNSPSAGYFSTLLDGYETILTPDVVKNLTVDSFRETVAKSKVDYGSLAIGKVVTDFDWFTLCEVSSNEAEDFITGRSYKIMFSYSTGRKFDAILQKKVTQTDTDSAVLVFLMENVPQDFDYTRKQTVQIVKDSFHGLSFPRSALRVVDGVQGVYVVEGNSVGFKKVDIIYAGDSLYYSRELSVTEKDVKQYLSRFDRVITEGKDLYVGKILD